MAVIDYVAVKYDKPSIFGATEGHKAVLGKIVSAVPPIAPEQHAKYEVHIPNVSGGWCQSGSRLLHAVSQEETLHLMPGPDGFAEDWFDPADWPAAEGALKRWGKARSVAEQVEFLFDTLKSDCPVVNRAAYHALQARGLGKRPMSPKELRAMEVMILDRKVSVEIRGWLLRDLLPGNWDQMRGVLPKALDAGLDKEDLAWEFENAQKAGSFGDEETQRILRELQTLE